MVLTVAVSDKDPLKRGASFECWLVKGNAGRTLRYEQWLQGRRIYPSTCGPRGSEPENWLQVLWTRQLGEELAAMGAPVVKTIDDCLDKEKA